MLKKVSKWNFGENYWALFKKTYRTKIVFHSAGGRFKKGDYVLIDTGRERLVSNACMLSPSRVLW